ncbi:MAG: hypothetical protein V7K18_08390 [Nostoc sp.]|uniref:hypothetical protein n=1 Tax=Nostoc sp. TaxID=1180 RepID=UPI002FF6B91C
MNVTDGFFEILTTCRLVVHSVTPPNVVIYANDDVYELTRPALVAELLYANPTTESIYEQKPATNAIKRHPK